MIPRTMLEQLLITFLAKDLRKFVEVCGPFLVSCRQVPHLERLFAQLCFGDLAL